MLPRHARIFVDTNAIQAAHRYGCWPALHKAYKLETAEICIQEATQPNRKGKKLVKREPEDLKKEIVAHAVTEVQRANLLHALQGRVDLDAGELDLIALAFAIKIEVWWLCGPDKATLRATHLLGILNRMCSLQKLAGDIGITLVKLEEQHTEKWLSIKRTQLQLGHGLI